MTSQEMAYDALIRAQCAFRANPSPALSTILRRLHAAHARDPLMQTFDVEVTDTFGGEANYCWVRRHVFQAPAGSSRSALVRRAKRETGWTGYRADVDDAGETISIRPSGMCVVAFVTLREQA